MSDLHPHWHSTGDDRSPAANAAPAKIVVTAGDGEIRAFASASRMPAAVVGIVVVLGLGLFFTQGWASLLGQASNQQQTGSVLNGIVIRITSGGVLPARVIARPGDTVTIINNQTIPHIFESKTLHDGSGNLLYTPAVFPGTSYTFKILKTELEQEHRFTSITSQNVTGTVAVSLNPCVSTVESTPGEGSKLFGGTDGVPLPSGQGKLEASYNCSAAGLSGTSGTSGTSGSNGNGLTAVIVGTGQSSSGATGGAGSSSGGQAAIASSSSAGTGIAGTLAGQGASSSRSAADAVSSATTGLATGTAQSATGQSGGVPYNPFTVSAVNTANTLANQNSGINPANAALHAGAGTLQQPKSGPEMWITMALSLAGLYIIVRKQNVIYSLSRD